MSSNFAKSGFRLDIQGLRAIAVILVVINHTFGWPSGGFVGVDVFYVISGYLISSQILREIQKTGSFSFRAFYARRARRIFPVAIFVAIVTLILSFILWFFPRALQSLLDAIGAILFVSNYHFMALGTDYLQQSNAVSPYEHYWSLSIEEQFYAAWPLVLLVLTSFIKSRRALLVAVTAIIAVSIGWGAYRTINLPAAAYFDTGARAWELLAGALVAISGTAKTRTQFSLPIRSWLSFFGVFLIVISGLLVSSAWMVPVPGVVPAVIGSVIVIWADADVHSKTILGNVVAQWLGKVSYSLYLWHFPIIVFAASLFGKSWVVGCFTIPVMLIISGLSYQYIERAVLDSSFLRKAANPAYKKWRFSFELKFSGAVLLAILGLALAQFYGPGSLRSSQNFIQHIYKSRFADIAATPSEAVKTQDIQKALAAKNWPQQIKTQLSQLSELQYAEAMTKCREAPDSSKTNHACHYTYGNIPVVVVGDSFAASWVPTVKALARKRGWDVYAIAYSNCSLFDVDVSDKTGSADFMAACRRRRAEMFHFVKQIHPKIVFLSASESALSYTGLKPDEAARAWEAGSERTFRKLADIDRVVVLEPPPWGINPLECATRYTSPANCIRPVSRREKLQSVSEADAAAKFENVTYVATRSWFCFDDRCPAFSSGLLTRVDGGHLTSAAATSLWRLLDHAMGHGKPQHKHAPRHAP